MEETSGNKKYLQVAMALVFVLSAFFCAATPAMAAKAAPGACSSEEFKGVEGLVKAYPNIPSDSIRTWKKTECALRTAVAERQSASDIQKAQQTYLSAVNVMKKYRNISVQPLILNAASIKEINAWLAMAKIVDKKPSRGETWRTTSCSSNEWLGCSDLIYITTELYSAQVFLDGSIAALTYPTFVALMTCPYISFDGMPENLSQCQISHLTVKNNDGKYTSYGPWATFADPSEKGG